MRAPAPARKAHHAPPQRGLCPKRTPFSSAPGAVAGPNRDIRRLRAKSGLIRHDMQMADFVPEPPFRRIGPERPASPVVLSVPHAGRSYSEALLRAARLSRFK